MPEFDDELSQIVAQLNRAAPSQQKSAYTPRALQSTASLDQLLATAAARHASDVLLIAGAAPMFRITGSLTPAAATPLDAEDVRALVLGGHGDTMVPILSNTTINGIPVRQLIAADKLAAIVDRTRNGGGEIVKLMGTSAFAAPASSAIAMATAYLKDQKRLLACAAYLNGEYGFKDLYMGVPIVIGAGGVEKIVPIELSAEEKAGLEKSAGAVREVLEASRKL